MPQFLETCFYLVRTRFKALKGLFLHLRSFSYKKSGLCSLGISVSKGDPCWSLRASPFLSLEPSSPSVQRSSHLNPRGILFSGIQNVQRGAFSSAVDMPGSLSYLTPYGLEQVWTNLMISTPVDSFCSNLWFRVHEREFYLHHLLLRALCAGLCSLKTVCEDLLHGSVIELDRLHILCRALSFSIASP